MSQVPPRQIIQLPRTIDPADGKQITTTYSQFLTPGKLGPPENRILHPSRVCDVFKFTVHQPDWTLSLRSLAAKLGDLPLEHAEPVELVRYPTGGFYYRHNGGPDRVGLLSVYLNDEYTGGELFFDLIGKLFTKIPAGMGLFWLNEKMMTHECRPVTSGEQWLLNVWLAKAPLTPTGSAWQA